MANNHQSKSPVNIQSENLDISLFAGAGGLCLGLYEAGFSPSHYFEMDSFCCKTLSHNIQSKSPTLKGTVHEGDIKNIDWQPFAGKVRLMAGGVPCQPFSLAGKHQAERDDRNLFPQMLCAVREVRPVAVLIENVRGLIRSALQPYFEYILRQLQVPSVAPKLGESWRDHDQRIKKYQCSFDFRPEYHVAWRLLDAADYGVPQNRHRVFIVATRINLQTYTFPLPTHSRNALVKSQLTGEYWRRHGLKRHRENLDTNSRIESEELENDRSPWLTARDAFDGLPKAAQREADTRQNHWMIPGARIYSGHKGSVLDWPSKTIKAGVHGVPGGENVFVNDDGNVQYYTLRETARLQTFPDEHFFEGARLHVTRQIGNAVPCKLAAAVAHPLYRLVMTGSKLLQKV